MKNHNKESNSDKNIVFKPKKKINHVRASDITPEPIEWLWPNIFAFGKYSLLVGEGGLGKSQLAIFIAAIVSTQGMWPHCLIPAKIGRIILLSAEDDAATTIAPRLIAAGANLDLIQIVNAVEIEDSKKNVDERHFDLTKDIDTLDGMLADYPDTTLIIIDPISAYLGTANSNNNSEVRRVLAPLSKLAQKYNVAIACVTHINKNDSNSAKSRVNGSVAFLNAARSSFLVAENPSNPDERLFVELKNNLSNLKLGYKFIIEEFKSSEKGFTTSKIKWLNETTTITATELLSNLKMMPKENSAEKEAADFLRAELLNGPLKSTIILELAKHAGISERTLRRAKQTLKIQAKKRQPLGDDPYWEWTLPNITDQNAVTNVRRC